MSYSFVLSRFLALLRDINYDDEGYLIYKLDGKRIR